MPIKQSISGKAENLGPEIHRKKRGKPGVVETLKTSQNQSKGVKTSKNQSSSGKATFTILEVCTILEMSRPTVYKHMQRKGVKPIQTGRGGKMWLTQKDLEALKNGS